eukprot:TRINITY_DN3908_c1_g1_i1.p1 TRINITY_DN3908_c1_g1~~TRINITY_DN3908_c1_g1_i1.p1  ORF type:complete len:210 (-),score=29.63 TRINITY_DN3908_c1_g1_i1:92-721(-)
MADVLNSDFCDCEVQILNGVSCTLTVHLGWTVATLKEAIEVNMGIPCYAQVLSDARGRLASKDVLHDVYLRRDVADAHITVFVVLVSLPAGFIDQDAQRVWEAFRAYSCDCGDTMSQDHLPAVLRFLDRFIDICHLGPILLEREQLSFSEVLSLVLKTKLWFGTREARSDFTADECFEEASCYSEYSISDADRRRLSKPVLATPCLLSL